MSRAKLLPKEVRKTGAETASQSPTSAAEPQEAPKVRRPLIRPREAAVEPDPPRRRLINPPYEGPTERRGEFTERWIKQTTARAYPSVCIVVRARDGKWVFGPIADEKKLEAMPKGKYAQAADASEAASKDCDIIMNTAPVNLPPKRKLLVRR